MAHDLGGLTKFSERGEWPLYLAEILDNHFGAIRGIYEMEFDDLVEVLGEHFVMILWGCAFEDFMTQDFEVEGGNIVDEYLRRRGWNESARNKAYMKAIRYSVMSLYEVSEVVPGQSLMARDLIRGGEPVLVSEKSGTKMLRQWDRIAARILPVMGRNVIAGGMLVYTLGAQVTLFDGLRRVFGKRNVRKLPALTDDDLRAVAPLFTQSWLFETLDRVLGIAFPTLTNTDGDEIVFHEAHFPLTAGTTQKAVTALLDGVKGLSREKAKSWTWIGEQQGGDAKAKDRFEPTRDDGSIVLGTLELDRRLLRLSANSAARAEEGKILVQDALGGLVGWPLTEIRTLEQVMAELGEDMDDAAPSDPSSQLSIEEVHAYLDHHYRKCLTLPIGMLGNKTPRHAVKSAGGREKVVEWLKYMENQTVRRSDPSDAMATYDFLWMWKELGIEHLRR